MSELSIVNGFQVITKPIEDSIAFMQADLAKSGLTPEDMCSVPILPTQYVRAMYRFPYYTRAGEQLDQLWKTRFDRDVWVDNDGKSLGKYSMPDKKQVGALSVLPYFNPQRLKLDCKIVHIHEGEKKAVAAIKAGRRAIGVGGAENWRAFGSKSAVHPDILAECQAPGVEEVWLWPDGDVLTNPNVSRGWGSFARCLEAAGLKVRCFDLHGKKYDDLLVENNMDAAAVEQSAVEIDVLRLILNHATLKQLVPGLTTSISAEGSERILPNEANLTQILMRYGPTASRYWYNVEQNVCMDGDKPLDEPTTMSYLMRLFQSQLSFHGRAHVSRSVVRDALFSAVYSDQRYPFKAELESYVWDGVPRLSTWMRDWCGGEDTDFAKSVARKLLISSVARVMTPGCELRWMCIMVGPQRCGKSGLPRALWGDGRVKIMNTADTEKDALIALSTHLVANFDELSAFYRRADTAHLKSIISTTIDIYRRPYEVTMQPHKRRCIILGSTNDPEFLPRDNSGNNRYVMVRVGSEGLFKFKEIYTWREQLWAEAVAAWRAGEEFSYVEGAEANAEQYISEDPMVEAVRGMLLTAEPLHGVYTHYTQYALKILDLAARLDIAPHNTPLMRRLAQALAALGFTKGRVRHKTQGMINFWLMEGEKFEEKFRARPCE